MDFGGISIFQFIKEKVFPDLKPYRMDVKDFEEALANGAGIPMKDSTREKLERKEAGVLTELKAEILRTGMTIEQERLLIDMPELSDIYNGKKCNKYKTIRMEGDTYGNHEQYKIRRC